MQKILLAIVILVQTAVLAAIAINQEILLRSAQCLTLEANVYDPRDIIKGHYIVLSYPAERVRISLFEGSRPTSGDRVYVEMQPSTNGFWTPLRAATSPLTVETGHYLLVGRVQLVEATQWNNSKQTNLKDPIVHIDYGIRRFYVNEEKGNPQGKLSVQVVVRRGGKPYLKDLLVNGKSIRES